MIVAASAGKADAVKIFKDLDGQLASDVEPIAEIGGTGRSPLAVQLTDQVCKGHDTIVAVVAILYDRRDQPLLSRLVQNTAHSLLICPHLPRQVAHPPRLVAKQRGGLLPDRLLLGIETRLMIRQVQPAMMAMDISALPHPLDERQHQRLALHRQGHASQTLAPWPRLVPVLRMVGGQGIEDLALPAGGHCCTNQAVSGLDQLRTLGQCRHPLGVQLPCPCIRRQIYRPARQVHRQRSGIVMRVRQRGKPCQILRLAFAPAWRIERDHPRPSQRSAGRDIAQHQTIVIRQPQRRIQHQLGKVIFEQRNAARDVAGSMVNMQRLPLGQRRMGMQRDDQPRNRLGRRFGQQPVTAANSLFFSVARDVQGNTLPGMGLLYRLVLRMKAADAHRPVYPGEPQGIPCLDAAGERRAGHHQPCTLNAKGAIDSEAETVLGRLLALGQCQQVRTQRFNAHSLRRGGRKYCRLRVAILCQLAAYLGLYLGYPRRVHAIGFGQRHGQRRVAGEL